MLRILKLFTLFTGSLSRDNCDISNGFSWCETSAKCVRVWEEPCLPITKECAVCLTENYHNQAHNCGNNCSLDILQNMLNAGFTGTDEYGCSVDETTIWCPSLDRCINPLHELCRDISVNPEPLCHEIRCSMFCDSGFQKDANGCDICKCSDVNSPQADTCDLEEQECPYSYVCPKVTEITHCGEGGIEGYTTYQLSLLLKDGTGAKNIYALFGDSQNNKDGITIHIPPAYQELENNIFNSNFGGVQQELIDIRPDARYDSWLTIGLTDGDPEHKLSSIGVDFDSWNNENALEITNGAIFLMDPEEKIIDGDEYIIMQLTIPNSVETNVHVNVQGKTNNNNQGVNGAWIERNVRFHISRPTPRENSIPNNCISWFDGCNTCSVTNGIKGGCTRRMCSSTSQPHCLSYSSGH